MHRTTASIARSWSVAHDGVTSGRSCGKGGSRLGPSACGCHSRTWVSTAGSAASQTPSDVRSRRARPGAPSATPEFPSDMLSDAHLPVTTAATTPKQARETTPPADAPPDDSPLLGLPRRSSGGRGGSGPALHRAQAQTVAARAAPGDQAPPPAGEREPRPPHPEAPIPGPALRPFHRAPGPLTPGSVESAWMDPSTDGPLTPGRPAIGPRNRPRRCGCGSRCRGGGSGSGLRRSFGETRNGSCH